MTAQLKTQIMNALSAVRTESGAPLAPDSISGLYIGPDGDALFALEVDPAMGPAMETLRLRAEKAARSVAGIRDVTVVLTAERKGGAAAAAVQAAPRYPSPPPRGGASADGDADPHGMHKNPPLTLPFRHIIAVGSGKGGVGKSTVAFNLAAALAAMGLSVSLLDADIYGPSVPRLTALAGQKPATGPDGKIIPLHAHGIDVMSIGFLIEEDKPMIWRGPMVQTAFYQMLRDVAWHKGAGQRDVLIIDMPPGTGDVQLTLAQKVPASGAVIVSTPQDLALIDARKAIAMFEKTGVKILGLIENMSYYQCPSCGHHDHVFGHGGAREEASKRGVPFLGEIPLNAEIREHADLGKIAPNAAYGEIAGLLYRDLAADSEAKAV